MNSLKKIQERVAELEALRRPGEVIIIDAKRYSEDVSYLLSALDLAENRLALSTKDYSELYEQNVELAAALEKETTRRKKVEDDYNIVEEAMRINAGDWLRFKDRAEAAETELTGYKFYVENVSSLPDCNTCGRKNTCYSCPKPGEFTRINCPLWRERKDG